MVWRSCLFPLAWCLAAIAAGAGEGHWSFVGKPAEKHSLRPDTALFDGKTFYNGDRAIWDAQYATKGCGVVFSFDEPVALTRMVVVTAKPNPLPMAQERTEFYRWDDKANDWAAPAVVADVTGRHADPTYTNGEIRTEWKADGRPTTAAKILLFGAGVWLTEVELYAERDGKETKLVPAPVPPAPPERAARLAPASHGGGAAVNLTMYREGQACVGNPNVLNRRDRVVWHFDLAPYVLAGKAARATLELDLRPMGALTANRLVLEAFADERAPVAAMDLISEEVAPAASFVYDRATASPLRFDVTALVNDALARGRGTLAFRLRNDTIDRAGNRHNKAEGALLPREGVVLAIEP